MAIKNNKTGIIVLENVSPRRGDKKLGELKEGVNLAQSRKESMFYT